MTDTYKLNYYTEVYKIILSYGDFYINKLPKKIFENIKSNINPEYNFEFDPRLSFKEQNVKKEAVALIVALKMQYWCEDENERKRYKELLLKNQEKHEKEKQEKYSVDNLFNNKKIEKIEKPIMEQISKEEPLDLQINGKNGIIKLYRKIKEYLLNIFRKEK